MKYNPHDYQIYAINFIKEHPIAAILLDMGMGKTSIVLAALNELMFDRIKAVESTELQTVLELRYLSYMRWEEIAIELGYGIDNVFRLHRNALDEIKIPKTIQ